MGVSVSLSEAEVHWREFLQSLVGRGLSGVELTISDAHPGLKAARKAVFGGIPSQRCQCHLQRNAPAYVPKVSLKDAVARDIRAVFSAPSLVEAENQLTRVVSTYEKTAPKLAEWMIDNLPEGLTVFSFPQPHWRLIRTTNGLERLNREIARRTRVVSIFPNEEA